MQRKKRILRELETLLNAENLTQDQLRIVESVVAFLKEHKCVKLEWSLVKIILGYEAKKIAGKFKDIIEDLDLFDDS